jgi:hypothetical protein
LSEERGAVELPLLQFWPTGPLAPRAAPHGRCARSASQPARRLCKAGTQWPAGRAVAGLCAHDLLRRSSRNARQANGRVRSAGVGIRPRKAPTPRSQRSDPRAGSLRPLIRSTGIVRREPARPRPI